MDYGSEQINPVPPKGFVPIPPPGFIPLKQVDEESMRKEVERLANDDVVIEQDKPPSLWDKVLRVFEPSWEAQRAKAAISMTKAKETGRAPHEFEPTNLEAVNTGFQSSVTGLIYKGKKPDGLTPAQMEELPIAQRILMQGATLAGDFPFMVAGAVAGIGGGPPTMLGGAFALPAGIRKVMMDKYEKGEIDSFGEFWRRLMGATDETMKGMATGVGTQAAGAVAGLPAEIAAMVAIGNALEGTVPKPTDFLDAAILIGGLKMSTKVAGKLRTIYKENGKTPQQVMMDIEEDPYIRKEILSDSKEVPEAYRKPEVVPEKPEPVKAEAPKEVKAEVIEEATIAETGQRVKIKTQEPTPKAKESFVVYHAKTKGEFAGGKPSVNIGSDADIMGKGFYIATDKNYVARNYGTPEPYNIQGKFATADQWTETLSKYTNKRIEEQRRLAREDLRKQGYDGVLQKTKRGDVGVIWNQAVLDRVPKAKEPTTFKMVEEGLGKEIDAVADEVSQRGAFTIREGVEPKGEAFKFGNTEIEERIQASQGVRQQALWDNIKDKFESISNKITREYENLPKTQEFAQLGFDLRELAKQKGVRGYEAIETIRGITLPLNKNEYNLFWRKVLLDDLAETAKEGKALPFGFDKDTLIQELARLNDTVKDNPKVTSALETRQKVWTALKTDYTAAMKEIGFDVSEKMGRENYFRHQVLDYMELKNITGTGKKLKTPTGRGFLKERKGSELDINTDYIQAEHEVMAQMLYDVEVAKTISAVDKNYNIAKQVRKEAKSKELENWKDAIPEGYTTWQPRDGNVFYLADSIPAKLAEKLTSGALEEIGLTAEQVKQVMAVGGKRKEFVIKNEIAATLDSLVTEKSNNIFSQGHKEILRSWKIWQLISPRRFIKYNFRNLTGDADAVFAGRPSVFLEVPKAVGELWEVHGQGKTMKGDLRDWFERGGMESNLQAQEMGELNRLKIFMHLQEQKTGLKEIPIKVWSQYWKTARLSTDVREAILRFSAYKKFLKEMTESKDGMPKDFAASIPEEVKGLADPKDRAYMMANDLLGAYDRVGVMGQALREHLFPFWSWKEANFKRYVRLFRNAASSDQLAETVGRKALGTLAKTPYQAARVGKFLLKATAFWSALQVWNNTKYSEEEAMLPPEVRFRPHVILGKDENGEILAFTRIGALGDFLEWFGLDAAPQYVDALFQGKMTPKEIAIDMAKSAPNIIVQGGEPFVKLGAELLSKRAMFPDIFNLRTVRDSGLHIFRGFGLENEYIALTGKPSKGYLESLTGFLFYKYDPIQTAYGDLMLLKNKFRESKGKGAEGFWLTPRGNALYDARIALRYKDDEAAINSMAKYFEMGGTPKDLKKSIESMQPLAGLTKQERAEFVQSLSKEDVRTLIKAQLFYMELQTGEDISKILYGDGK